MMKIPTRFPGRKKRSHYRWILELAFLGSLALLSGCGNGGTSASGSGSAVAGNWQFQMNTDGSFASTNSICAPPMVCVSGFLTQTNGSLTGQLLYSFAAVPQTSPPTLCGGSATVTGKISGQNVSLNAIAGSQAFTFTGTLSSDGSTMSGSYSSSGPGCGTAQSGMQWTANSVPPLNGTFLGNFYSTNGSSVASNRAFQVTGTLAQGPNIGASSATVSGMLTFQGYPCASTASVNGQISGNSVSLQVFATNGLNVGTISPIFNSTPSGYVLNGAAGTGYNLTTKTCPSPSGTGGDAGIICLALGTYSNELNNPLQFSNLACMLPITVTPASLAFPLQLVGSPQTSQSITLTNSDPSGTTLTGLSLSLAPTSNDFNQQTTFGEQDNCAGSQLNTPFNLGPQQSCTVTVLFTPQESCPWISSPSQCPPFQNRNQTSLVTVHGLPSSDGETSLKVPIAGIGMSAIEASIPELDFGAEAPPAIAIPQGEPSPPQSVTFTNQGNSPVQILPSVSSPPCGSTPGVSMVQLPRPLVGGVVSGIQVVSSTNLAPPSVSYVCDVDSDLNNNPQPDFPITADSCSGQTLAPLQSCTVTLQFQPGQRAGLLTSGLDFFLELNTLQCTSTTTTDCEIDAGRFPVELKTSPLSPLRVLPAAGFNFGLMPIGQPSLPLTITLFNDPQDPHAQTVTFTGSTLTGADFAVTNNCGASLSPGNSCTMTVIFTPSIVGFDQGSLVVGYDLAGIGGIQTLSFRGTGQ
jgi:hypothetical protein